MTLIYIANILNFHKTVLVTLYFLVLVLFGNTIAQAQHFPRGTHDVLIPTVNGVRTNLLKNITKVVEQSIAEGYYPGAVVLAAHHGHIIYQGVFGNRRIVPNIAPMHFNTIFDLASLTKVVATTPAIMQLMEQGKLSLDVPVAKYWPAFASNGKENITIRELLTHTSGLPVGISIPAGYGKAKALQQIEKLKPQHVPGKTFLYSDVNFLILAHLVEIITHERFEQYVQDHIFKPLGMSHTSFLPAASLRDHIAPTEKINNKLRWGQVHDRNTAAMGGVSGNAGLFSNASDLAIYLQCLLNGGRIPQSQHKKNPHYILSPLTVLKMTTPQTASSIIDTRGFGWDIGSYLSNRGVLFPTNSFGHTGWTGTSVWIDPTTKTWLIILTSRAHPKPLNKNKLVQDRNTIATIVAASITNISTDRLKNTSKGEIVYAQKKKKIS